MTIEDATLSPSSAPPRRSGAAPAGVSLASAISARAKARAAEAAVARGVFLDRGPEGAVVEVGPEVGQEDELGVGRLPEQEIRDPLLAGGPDDEIGIGDAVRVERSLDRLDPDRAGVELAGRRLRGD